MAAAWPKFEPDDAKIALWSNLFEDVDFQLAQVALKTDAFKHIPPSVAELRQAVVEITEPGSEQLPAPRLGATL